MDKNKLYSIDGILWIVDTYNQTAAPLCPKDRIKLSVKEDLNDMYYSETHVHEIYCEDCAKTFKLKRSLHRERIYVAEKVKAAERKNYSIVDIDGIQTPVTEKVEAKIKGNFFCIAQVRNSKRGPQVVIYAGKNGLKTKSQIFITPNERRLSFDQNDINPADVFAKITAEFIDGTSHEIKRKPKN